MHWILVLAWHWCTGSYWLRGTGALDPDGGVALVHWILVVAWHWCTGSYWLRGTGALDQCGGVKLDPGGAALR